MRVDGTGLKPESNYFKKKKKKKILCCMVEVLYSGKQDKEMNMKILTEIQVLGSLVHTFRAVIAQSV
jgi:hypothetical protein